MSNKRDFYIPRIEESNEEVGTVTKARSNNSTYEKFASSFSGYNVKDDNVFPYVKYSNNGAQYEDLKDKQYQKKNNQEYQNPKDKYSPDRIPSYLRREELAITRKNIQDFKGERLTDKEMYQKNRENYGRYSDETIFSDGGKTLSKGIAFEESSYQNPVYQNERRETVVKPTKSERSTLVVNKREEQTTTYFDDPFAKAMKAKQETVSNGPKSVLVRSNPSKNYQEPQMRNSYDYYQEREVVKTTSRYEEPKTVRNEYYQNVETPRYNDYQERVETPKYNDYQERVETPRYNDYYEQKVETPREEYVDYNNRYQEEAPKEKHFLSTSYEEDDHFYDDIDIPLQAAKKEEIQELDSYDMNATYKKETKPVVKKKRSSKKYKFPPVDILKHSTGRVVESGSEIDFQRTTIDSTLEEFKIGGHVVNVTKGPTVTQFEVKLDPGVKVNKIEQISRNLQMNLESDSIRIEAPIPGKSTIGIEVPSRVKSIVHFGDMLTPSYLKDGKPLNVVLGKTIDGGYKYVDISDMPHALVAGRTGSGKTVCIHSIITSILYKATPDEVKLMLIDPKRNELMFFDNVPHLASPIIDDTKLAAPALKWAVEEMERRNELFRLVRKRNIQDYNEYASRTSDPGVSTVPYIVIVIDEFADLMTTAGDSFETYVQRLTQKARSTGIHMIIATQRPSVDVIKGTIKGNIQARIAFSVTTQVDSATILDHSGAEKLLGKGDMLYTNGGPDVRVQGSFITTDEIEEVVSCINENEDIDYMFTLDELETEDEADEFGEFDGQDELLDKVAKHVVSTHRASVNQLQRVFNIGYNRADDMMNTLEKLGVVSPAIQGKPRTVLVEMDELERILNVYKG